MAANIDRFRKELADLIHRAGMLDFAAIRYADRADFDRQILAAFPNDPEKIEKFKKATPEFTREYESWYSEAIRVVAQLLPDRLADFKAQYEVPKTRKSLDPSNYTIHDMIHGISQTYGNATLASGIPRLRIQINILKASERRFDSSLFEIRQLVQADLFDGEIDAARELLKNKFVRAAGAVAGVVLEKHLKQVAEDHGIKILKAKPTLSVLNDALKDGSIIDVPQWRFNQHLGDIRNACDHAREPEPTKEQVQDLLDGTAKVMKTIS